MVILNKNKAAAPAGMHLENRYRTAAAGRHMAAVFRHPNFAAENPPAALPNTIARVLKTAAKVVVFHENATAMPM